jgi:biotin carboxyl carrier protein
MEERVMFKVTLRLDGQPEAVDVAVDRADRPHTHTHVGRVDERGIEVELENLQPGEGWLRHHGKIYPYVVARRDQRVYLWLRGRQYAFDIVTRTPRRATADAAAAASSQLTAPMPGTVRKIQVQAGDPVDAHQPLILMESMKMEMTLSLPRAGRVQAIACEEGQLVELGQVLITLDESDDAT